MVSEKMICGKFKSYFRVDIWDRHFGVRENDALGQKLRSFHHIFRERKRCDKFQALI